MLFLVSCSKVKSSETIINNLNKSYSRKGSNQGIVNSVSYKDGTYIGEGDLKDYGKEVATITISQGKITNALFQRLDADGNETLKRDSADVKIVSIGKEFLKDDIKSNIDLLINEVVKKQSYDISIPTSNKELLLNWKLAVKRAIEKAKK
jgi:uncharacterized protein with FMN-binding domain